MSASTWGNPSATGHVFLLHGILNSSHSWHRIAPELASRGKLFIEPPLPADNAQVNKPLLHTGYFVTAPDLLGHGNARRSSDYTIAALADELRPYFTSLGGTDHPYDIVIGYSLGGLVVSALLPLLKSTRPVRVILCDPPLEQSPEACAYFKSLFCNVARSKPSPEILQQGYPSFTREDVIFTWLSTQLCDVTVVEAIFDQNTPWSFSHLLSTVPENVKVAVLAPAQGAVFKEGDLKGCLHVASKIVLGTSHQILNDAPDAVIEAALHGVESQPEN